MATGKKLTAAEIHARLAMRGLKLIGEYQTSNLPGEFECAAGHRFTGRTLNVMHGQKQCPECKKQRLAFRTFKNRLSGEEINEQLYQYGFQLVSQYRNANSPIQVVCGFGHITHTTLSRIREGARCSRCLHYTPEEFPAILGIKLLNRERAGEEVDLDAVHVAEKAIRDFVSEHGAAAYRELVDRLL